MPISAFAHALRAYQSGDLTEEELSWELDRQLTIEKASPVALLEILKAYQIAKPLPGVMLDAMTLRLEEWPRDPTIVTGLGAPRGERAPCVGVGDILQGRFSLVALIGEGGMSRVFKAIDLRRVEAGAADPYVAVKVLTEPLSEYFGSVVALQGEAHKLQSLNHPNIVRVIDCDRDGNTVFMTMEYLAGASLQKKLRAGGGRGLEESAAISLLTGVGRALDHAHRNHIVHGDLKPGNVIVTDDGEVKVIDFGMARFIARRDDAVSGGAMPKAVTPRYASPELVAGRNPEPADDVYALACMACEALTGKHPFGQHGDPRSRDRDEQPLRPPGLADHRYSALVRALAFDRSRRTPSIRQFLDELLTRRADVMMQGRAWVAVAAIVVLIVVAYRLSADRLKLHATAAARVTDAVPGTVLHDCPDCPPLTVLPAGSFQQGSGGAASSPFEQPQHTVMIGRAFAMSTNEVTVAEFREFAADTHRDLSGCNTYDGRWQFQTNAGWQAPGFEQAATHPVTCVSWDDAVAYAAWLSGRGGHAYRLPSASEWEYAARAGAEPGASRAADTATACLAANVADRSAAQRFPGWTVFDCNDGYVNTAPVGSFKSNAFGLNDLLGNVFEWVQDCWHDDYGGAPADGSARLDGDCNEHELRGGSWFTPPQYVTVAYRNRFDGAYRSSTTGFRLVRDLAP